MAPSTSARNNNVETVLKPKKPFEPAGLTVLPLDPDLLFASGEDEENGFGDLHFF